MLRACRDHTRAYKKPFFLWLNPTRMHVVTHLSPKCDALRNSDNNWTIQEAVKAQIEKARAAHGQ